MGSVLNFIQENRDLFSDYLTDNLSSECFDKIQKIYEKCIKETKQEIQFRLCKELKLSKEIVLPEPVLIQIFLYVHGPLNSLRLSCKTFKDLIDQTGVLVSKRWFEAGKNLSLELGCHYEEVGEALILQGRLHEAELWALRLSIPNASSPHASKTPRSTILFELALLYLDDNPCYFEITILSEKQRAEKVLELIEQVRTLDNVIEAPLLMSTYLGFCIKNHLLEDFCTYLDLIQMADIIESALLKLVSVIGSEWGKKGFEQFKKYLSEPFLAKFQNSEQCNSFYIELTLILLEKELEEEAEKVKKNIKGNPKFFSIYSFENAKALEAISNSLPQRCEAALTLASDSLLISDTKKAIEYLNLVKKMSWEIYIYEDECVDFKLEVVRLEYSFDKMLSTQTIKSLVFTILAHRSNDEIRQKILDKIFNFLVVNEFEEIFRNFQQEEDRNFKTLGVMGEGAIKLKRKEFSSVFIILKEAPLEFQFQARMKYFHMLFESSDKLNFLAEMMRYLYSFDHKSQYISLIAEEILNFISKFLVKKRRHFDSEIKETIQKTIKEIYEFTTKCQLKNFDAIIAHLFLLLKEISQANEFLKKTEPSDRIRALLGNRSHNSESRSDFWRVTFEN